MKTSTVMMLLASSVALGCKTGEPATTGTQLKDVSIFKNGALCSSSGGSADCTSKLVSTQSGPDTTCRNNDNSLHWWPIDSSSDCHGWQATDPFGKKHDNSARNIRCSADGLILLYDQYAGSTTCQGTPVSKTFVLNECHQGRPRILWDKGRDFSCCGASSINATVASVAVSVSVGTISAGQNTNSVFASSSGKHSGSKSGKPDSKFGRHGNKSKKDSSSKFGGRQSGGKAGKKGTKGNNHSATAAAQATVAAPAAAPATAPVTSGCFGEVDKSNLCPSYSSHCQNGQKYFAWMKQNCPKTCCSALAAPPAIIPPPSDCSSSESDQNAQLCRAYASHCNAGQKYTAWMTGNCPQTCCTELRGLKRSCASTVDTASANMCEQYSSHCVDGQRYFAWMSVNCAKTCCK